MPPFASVSSTGKAFSPVMEKREREERGRREGGRREGGRREGGGGGRRGEEGGGKREGGEKPTVGSGKQYLTTIYIAQPQKVRLKVCACNPNSITRDT